MNLFSRLTLAQRLLVATLCVSAVLAAILLIYLAHARTSAVEASGLTAARAVSSQIVALRAFYTKEIASRAKKAGMQLGHDFADKDGMLPLPATLVKTLGESIAKEYPGSKLRLMSAHPFPNRTAAESKLDAFQMRALASLEKDPKTPIHQMETLDGRRSIRYAVADIMAEGCVACHNSNPQSPKRDWKVGDVRGIVEVVVPVAEVDEMIASSSLLTVGLTLGGLGVMGWLVGWLVQWMVARPMRELNAGVNMLTSGDLTHRLTSQRNDEVGKLMNALDAMRTRFLETLSAVRTLVTSINVGSTEIAAGNLDLSERTEQTASSLEKTASSMEQLGATVKQNADSAGQGNRLAQEASSLAVKGGDVVGQAVETMKGINDSSRKIADIISVIDGIAFQTNILALNAAVEAARAGEQGRGFAVVATEVRSLAGRSADAAREIKSLINASVERVERGTAQVDQAGAAMTEVVNSIQKVTQTMGEISAASNEQATGINQVGQSVAQMDQATQQNAALVEEMAAAANSLQTQAQDLVRMVAMFKLGEAAPLGGTAGAGPSAPPTRGPAVARSTRPQAIASAPRRLTPPAKPRG